MNFRALIPWLCAITILLFTKAARGNTKNSVSKDSLAIHYIPSEYGSLNSFPYFSMVLGDPKDPIHLNGLHFELVRNHKKVPARFYKISLSASDAAVVADSGLIAENDAAEFVVRIKPWNSGYSTITIQCLLEKQTIELNFFLAVSINTDNFNGTWLNGISDASAAISLGRQHCIIADDEQNQLLIYKFPESGGPLQIFDYNSLLKLTDCNNEKCDETDIEAAAQNNSTGTIYWFGSMSNGKAPKHKIKRNRDLVFSTSIDPDTNGIFHIKVQHSKSGLRNQICKWGNRNGLKLTGSANEGADPKREDGFNLEGAAFSKDNKTLYLAMRAPLIKVNHQKMALLIPVLNFENWFQDESSKNELNFGDPVLLNLNNRGIRDMIPFDSLGYLIVAGSSDDENLTALYAWNGQRENQPRLILDRITDLNIEALIPLKNGSGVDTTQVQAFCDDGRICYYSDGIASKFLSISAFKKFRSVTLHW